MDINCTYNKSLMRSSYIKIKLNQIKLLALLTTLARSAISALELQYTNDRRKNTDSDSHGFIRNTHKEPISPFCGVVW